DRRWCQGNLQHVRLLCAQGLKMPSRLHLAMGIMSYLASPLWLMLLIAAAVNLAAARPLLAASYLGRLPQLSLSVSHALELLELAGATLALLYGPKLAALAVALADRGQRRVHGGALSLIRSALCESLFATLLAPVVMLAHCWFFACLLMGRATGWNVQRRDD